MKYRNIILFALLIPRLEFLEISGVNSSMRFDVFGLALVSALPLFRSLSYSTILVAFMVILMSLIQMLFFDAQISRMIVGITLYLSIILFSQYHKIINLDDVLYICRWFFIVNATLHISDMFFLTASDHNYSGRYGVFNQHFAFASAILISYFFLYYHNATNKWVNGLFLCSFLLSGSRGLILAVGLCIILANLRIIKNIRTWTLLTLSLVVLVSGTFYFAPENIHLQRMIHAYSIVVEGFSEIATILSDPAINVRVSNIYNYIDFVKGIDFTMFYIAIGGGPYSFFDYSIQYGKPGHFDNLYFRIVSEYGLLSLVFIIMLIFVRVRRSSYAAWYVIALLIGGLVSEAILTLKVGHLFFLTLFFLKDTNAKNS